MIKRNLEHPEVKTTRYRAHGGGVAHMILDTRHLQTLMFLAHASVAPVKNSLVMWIPWKRSTSSRAVGVVCR